MARKHTPIARAPGGLNYYSCKVDELRQFIEARTGETFPEKTAKATLVPKLLEADRDPGAFRFQDLPAELRNAVYGNVLTLRPSKHARWPMSCNPEVIRCSKIIRQEAEAILYGENEVEIDLASSSWPVPQRPRPQFFRRINIASVHYWSSPVGNSRDMSTLRMAPKTWPRHLLKMLHLKIYVRITATGPTHPVAEDATILVISTNHLLFSLMSYLATSTELKALNVQVDVDNLTLGDEALRMALRPFTYAVALQKFTLTCTSNMAVKGMIEHDMSGKNSMAISSRPTSDLFRKARKLRDQAIALRFLMTELDLNANKEKLSSRIFEMGELLDFNNLVTQREEDGFVRYVQDLEDLVGARMKQNVDRAIQRKVNGLNSLRHAVDGM